jgi:hypothetical protein
MTKLEIFEMLHEAAKSPWPTACIPSKHGGVIITEDNNGLKVFYGLALIVDICRATGCNYYVIIEAGYPAVRVYE